MRDYRKLGGKLCFALICITLAAAGFALCQWVKTAHLHTIFDPPPDPLTQGRVWPPAPSNGPAYQPTVVYHLPGMEKVQREATEAVVVGQLTVALPEILKKTGVHPTGDPAIDSAPMMSSLIDYSKFTTTTLPHFTTRVTLHGESGGRVEFDTKEGWLEVWVAAGGHLRVDTNNGTVSYFGDIDTNEAARLFWDALARARPHASTYSD